MRWLVAVALAMGGTFVGAQETNPEDLATAEAFVKVCSDSLPERASEFAQSLGPPYSCPSVLTPGAGRTRETAGYHERYDAIVDEMVLMPKDQLRLFCETLLTKHC